MGYIKCKIEILVIYKMLKTYDVLYENIIILIINAIT